MGSCHRVVSSIFLGFLFCVGLMILGFVLLIGSSVYYSSQYKKKHFFSGIKKRRCRACGGRMPITDNFCIKCGHELKDIIGYFEGKRVGIEIGNIV